jgi:hypothetical protein
MHPVAGPIVYETIGIAQGALEPNDWVDYRIYNSVIPAWMQCTQKSRLGLHLGAAFQGLSTRSEFVSRRAVLTDLHFRSIIHQEAAKLLAATRMTELAQRFRLDLTNAFTRHVELLAHFFQRVVGVHVDAEAHA